jgi:hypothetical protein
MKSSYVCPMHSDIQSSKPGRCSKCGMALVRSTKQELGVKGESPEPQATSYAPLAIIICLIAAGSFALSLPTISTKELISNFMIGFFLIFASFKLTDLKGFAQGYSTYDLIAKKWFSYGYIFPFIELSFAFLMILRMFEAQVLVAEIVVMTLSGIGVLIKLLKHEKFQCVCLGTFLKVPLTYVTLIEDFGMAALAVILLVLTPLENGLR